MPRQDRSHVWRAVRAEAARATAERVSAGVRETVLPLPRVARRHGPCPSLPLPPDGAGGARGAANHVVSWLQGMGVFEANAVMRAATVLRGDEKQKQKPLPKKGARAD